MYCKLMLSLPYAVENLYISSEMPPFVLESGPPY